MNNTQPLDTLMTQLGLSNADLVNASKEQLSFKMVQKGRKGRRLSPNIQEKILSALLSAKPDLKLRRRDLFRYEPGVEVVKQITDAISKIREKKIRYPKFIDLLIEAGVNHYFVDVAQNHVTFYGSAGDAHMEQGPAVSSSVPGMYDEAAIRSAIGDAQKEVIDHPTFLKRIYDAGIVTYEVHTRNRKIEYRSKTQIYKETIPSSNPTENVAIEKKVVEQGVEKKAKSKKPKNTKRIKKTGKFIKSHRVKKRK